MGVFPPRSVYVKNAFRNRTEDAYTRVMSNPSLYAVCVVDIKESQTRSVAPLPPKKFNINSFDP